MFSLRNILITVCVGRVWIVIRYFLLEKQAFHGLLKVIGIQKYDIHVVKISCRSKSKVE